MPTAVQFWFTTSRVIRRRSMFSKAACGVRCKIIVRTAQLFQYEPGRILQIVRILESVKRYLVEIRFGTSAIL